MKGVSHILSATLLAIGAVFAKDLDEHLNEGGKNKLAGVGKCVDNVDIDKESDRENYSVDIDLATDGGAAATLCHSLGFGDCSAMVQFIAQLVNLGWQASYMSTPDSGKQFVKQLHGSPDNFTEYTNTSNADFLDVKNPENADQQFVYGPVTTLPDWNKLLDNSSSYGTTTNESDGYGVRQSIISVSWFANRKVQVAALANGTNYGIKASFVYDKGSDKFLDKPSSLPSEYSDDEEKFIRDFAVGTTEFGEAWVSGADDKDLSSMWGRFEFADYGLDVAIEPLSNGIDTSSLTAKCNDDHDDDDDDNDDENGDDSDDNDSDDDSNAAAKSSSISARLAILAVVCAVGF